MFWNSDKAEHLGGTATENEKAKCEVCGESYGSLKTHEHAYTISKVDDKYLVSDADCDSKAIYKKSCSCDEAGTETFESGEPLGHSYASIWSYDETNHWKECGREGCEETTTKTPHLGGNATPTKKATCEDCDQEYGDFKAAAATFEFGDNASDASLDNSGKHSNRSTTAVTEYSESNNSYILELNEPSAVYKSAKDDKCFGCLKLGTTSKAGSFSFTVSEDINLVIIYIYI